MVVIWRPAADRVQSGHSRPAVTGHKRPVAVGRSGHSYRTIFVLEISDIRIGPDAATKIRFEVKRANSSENPYRR